MGEASNSPRIPGYTKFGKWMAEFRFNPSAWSPFRLIYYMLLMVGWTLMFLQMTTSIYASWRCYRAEPGSNATVWQHDCTMLLGATLPLLPFLVLRRINHQNKVELYGVDAMNIFDLVLVVLIFGYVVALLCAAHGVASKIQTAFSVVATVFAVVVFFNPSSVSDYIFNGVIYDTVAVIVSLPVGLGLLLFPWLIDAMEGDRRNESRRRPRPPLPNKTVNRSRQ